MGVVSGMKLRKFYALFMAVCWVQAAWADGMPRPLSDADFPKHSAAEVKLGQLLFYDPILSGNKNIACATCHHPSLATGDGVSLGIGEGGIGLAQNAVQIRTICRNNAFPGTRRLCST